jgi:hypothetical protein
MIMAEAGRAVSMLDKKAEKEQLPDDIEAVAASIKMMGDRSKTISSVGTDESAKRETKSAKKAEKVEKPVKPKAERVAKPKTEKYVYDKLETFRTTENLPLPEFKSDSVEFEDGSFCISGNRIDWIKSEYSRLMKEGGHKKSKVYIASDYVLTTNYNIPVPDCRLQIEGIGKRFINITICDDKWAILPDRQDMSFKLVVVPEK